MTAFETANAVDVAMELGCWNCGARLALGVRYVSKPLPGEGGREIPECVILCSRCSA